MNTLDKFKLNGKICVITGGAGLLGIKHAEALLDGGARVVLVDINKEKLNAAIAQLSVSRLGYYYRVCGKNFDITDEESVKSNIQIIWDNIGPISVLINNAANCPKLPEPRHTRFESFDLRVWQADFDVNVTGAFLMSREIGKRMAQNRGGVIVNIASDLGIIASDQRIYKQEGLADDEQPVKPVSYTVTKHALIGLTKYMATYWADKGVRVNSFSPASVYNNQPEDFVKKLTNLIPFGRMSNADEFKAAILFLCSDASSYMTGANLVIDGGRTCW